MFRVQWPRHFAALNPSARLKGSRSSRFVGRAPLEREPFTASVTTQRDSAAVEIKS
jgi:hypothetical protein